MPAIETIPVPLGYQAPDFQLEDAVSGKLFSLQELRGENATVVVFICNHCPYVKHVIDGIVRMANDYTYREAQVQFIAISSNDIAAYPQDAPDKMKAFAEAHHFPFPYLYDATQETARAYHAACTPDFSIFDSTLRCVYRGQMDDSRPGNGKPVDGKDVREALDALLKGEPVNPHQRPSIGCSIKWKDPALRVS